MNAAVLHRHRWHIASPDKSLDGVAPAKCECGAERTFQVIDPRLVYTGDGVGAAWRGVKPI